MKMSEYHIVPLSRQAVAILRELHPVSRPEGYVFPQARKAWRPISENTLNVASLTQDWVHDGSHAASAQRFPSSITFHRFAGITDMSLCWNGTLIEKPGVRPRVLVLSVP
jgi:integrase